MVVKGTEYLQRLLNKEVFEAKMVFNFRGALVFPRRVEHRDQKAPGISYEVNYQGNALAAMLSPGKIEIRYHEHYSDARVTTLLGELASHPELSVMQDWAVYYQGRQLK